MEIYNSEGFPIPQEDRHKYVGIQSYDSEGFPFILGEGRSKEDQDFIRKNGFEAFRAKLPAEQEEATIQAIGEAVREDNPTMSIIAPRVAQNIAETGEIGFDLEANFDMGSFPYRTGSAIGETGAIATGEMLGLRDAPQGGYAQNFIESQRAIGGREGQGAVESFAEDVVRDPLNIIPGLGQVGRLGKAIYKAPIVGKTLKQIDMLPQIIANNARKLGRAKEGLRQTGKVNDEIKKGITKEVMSGKGSIDDYNRFVTQAQSRMADQRVLPNIPTSSRDRAINLGLKGSGELGLEGARQGIEGDLDATSLVMGGLAPVGANYVGTGAKGLAKKMLDSKVKFKPSKSNVRYKPDTGVLLEQGLLSNKGMGATLENVQARSDELGAIRSGEVSDQSMAFYDAKDEIKEAIAEGSAPDLTKLRNSGVNVDNYFDDVKIDIESQRISGDITDLEAKKMVDIVDSERDNFSKFTTLATPQGSFDLGVAPIDVFSSNASRYFDVGKVNRNLGAKPPTAEKVKVGNIMWDASRKYVNDDSGLGAVNKEFAKILPLKENLEDIQAKMDNANMLGITGLNTLERIGKSNPLINAVYGLRGAENLFSRGNSDISARNISKILSTPAVKRAVRSEDEDDAR